MDRSIPRFAAVAAAVANSPCPPLSWDALWCVGSGCVMRMFEKNSNRDNDDDQAHAHNATLLTSKGLHRQAVVAQHHRHRRRHHEPVEEQRREVQAQKPVSQGPEEVVAPDGDARDEEDERGDAPPPEPDGRDLQDDPRVHAVGHVRVPQQAHEAQACERTGVWGGWKGSYRCMWDWHR